MVLDDTDWDEVAELLTDSYRFCAPQKLRRQLDRGFVRCAGLETVTPLVVRRDGAAVWLLQQVQALYLLPGSRVPGLRWTATLLRPGLDGACLTASMSTESEDASAWVVESIGGVPTFDPRPEITLTEDGHVVGTTGVNRIRGTYEARDEAVRISGAGMTRMAGSPLAMEQERRFLAALEGWHTFLVRDDRLELGDADTGLVCVSTHRPPRPA